MLSLTPPLVVWFGSMKDFLIMNVFTFSLHLLLRYVIPKDKSYYSGFSSCFD